MAMFVYRRVSEFFFPLAHLRYLSPSGLGFFESILMDFLERTGFLDGPGRL